MKKQIIVLNTDKTNAAFSSFIEFSQQNESKSILSMI